MNVLKFVFGHRGAVNLVRRSAQIAARFGPTPERMGGRFERFMNILDEFSIRPTFPITALPMSRNPAFAQRLVERGAELAVHAWSHVDLSALDLARQRAHMSRAVELFRSCSVPFTGFRAPYLHWNDDTMRVVGEFGFRYSSNQTVWWDVLDTTSLDEKQKE
jgi:peptidoglycan/xylan/chitin deacetylase (PgdA/CDA1 family)